MKHYKDVDAFKYRFALYVYPIKEKFEISGEDFVDGVVRFDKIFTHLADKNSYINSWRGKLSLTINPKYSGKFNVIDIDGCEIKYPSEFRGYECKMP